MAEGRVELPGSFRARAAGARQVGIPDPADEVEVTITLRGPALPSADDASAAPIDAAAFAAEYGADIADAQAVQSELEQLGLEVYDISLAGRSVHARGTVQQLESAFGVSLAIYETAGTGSDGADDEQRQFRGRNGSIQVPVALEGIVTGVFGLDDRRVARRAWSAHRGTTAQNAAAAAAQAPALTPPDFEARYQFPAGDGAGQAVAIAEFGGAYFPADVAAFCGKYHRAVPSITPISAGYPLYTIEQIQQMPSAKQQEILGDSVEVMMDIEIVAALCPAADITVYFAPFTQKGWIDLINAVLAARPTPLALSVSWGLAEDSAEWSAAALKEINGRLQAASMLGVTICAAAGDDGAGDQETDDRAHVNFPASSQFVLSVGGTMINEGPPEEEVAWWVTPGDRAGGGGSTGGGVSAIFPRPAWQTISIASVNTGSIDGRVVPDVAALAGPPYYDLIFQGQDSPNGGTSAATPLWAALMARMAGGLPAGSQLRFLAPLLYAASADGLPVGKAGCADVTDGNNNSPGVQGYSAGAGFDAVSGWGTPVGTTLQRLLG